MKTGKISKKIVEPDVEIGLGQGERGNCYGWIDRGIEG